MNQFGNMSSGYLRGFSILVVAGAMLLPDAVFAKSREERAGDVGKYLPVIAGAGVAAWKGDAEGGKQLVRSTLASILATEGAKRAFDQTYLGERPNGGKKSFPSGHAAFACSGSAYLGERYGWEYGLPALAVAAGVGASRVDADKHHWRDVIAGCGLSYALNEFFVTKEGEEELYPVVGPEIIGFRWKLDF